MVLTRSWKESNVATRKRRAKKDMFKENVVRAKTIRQIAKETADDPKVIESVKASMNDLAMHQTVSFEEAFALPRPR